MCVVKIDALDLERAFDGSGLEGLLVRDVRLENPSAAPAPIAGPAGEAMLAKDADPSRRDHQSRTRRRRPPFAR